jgi:hypothetical protein
VLAQVVWLVTTWNPSPDWRGLLYAGQSAAFLVASRFLRNSMLEFGAYPNAALAVGLASYFMKPLDPAGLYRGAIISAVMLLNAFEVRLQRTAADDERRRLQEMFFTATALVMCAVTTWNNTTAPWRGLLLAIESLAFVVVGALVRNPTLRLGGFAFAGLSAAWSCFTLAQQCFTLELGARTGLVQHTVVGLLLLAGALWERRKLGAPVERMFRPPTTTFSALALLVWLVTTWTFTPKDSLAVLLAVEALVFTASFYVLHLAEVSMLGQVFLVLAPIQCVALLAQEKGALPWWNPAVVTAVTVGLSHWWQRPQRLACTGVARQTIQALYAAAAVAVLFFWLKPHFSAPAWLAFTSALAVAVTLYGYFTRAWFLAGAGQCFLLVSVGEFAWQLYLEPAATKPAWFYTLAPIATLFATAWAAGERVRRTTSLTRDAYQTLYALTLLYRGAALVMSLAWIFEYVPERDRFWVLVLVGGFFFAWGGAQQTREPLVVCAAFTVVGFVTFWGRFNAPMIAYWPNLAAILFFLAQQRVTRRWPDRFVLHPHVHTAAILLGTCSLWLYVSRLVMNTAGGYAFYLTAAWAALAFAIFCVGFVLRERVYRWHGLAVLACALGRVVIFDVWKLESTYRILSFMALGVVLIILGFIYNRYQEKIREWL